MPSAGAPMLSTMSRRPDPACSWTAGGCPAEATQNSPVRRSTVTWMAVAKPSSQSCASR